MPIPQDTASGYLLAALLHPGEEESASAALAEETRQAVRVRQNELALLTTKERSAALTAALGQPQAVDAEDERPLMRAMVATMTSKDVGRRWLSAAPPLRRGFVAPRDLRDAVTRWLAADDGAEARAARECAELGTDGATP